MKSNTIMFIDLEGTILNEQDGEVHEEDLTNFISLINQVESLTDSEVAIHLVSPVEYSIMKKIKDNIDKSIENYNSRNNTKIRDVVSAACNMKEQEYHKQIDNTIIPLPSGVNRDEKLLGLTEKELYVRYLLEYLKNRTQIQNLIYIGNGRNDIRAMKYVKSQRGIVICPQNSRTEVRKIADYTSELHALKGVNEALTNAIKNNLQKGQYCYGD